MLPALMLLETANPLRSFNRINKQGLSGKESRQFKQKRRGFASEGFQRAIEKPFGGALGQNPKLKKPSILRKVASWVVRN